MHTLSFATGAACAAFLFFFNVGGVATTVKENPRFQPSCLKAGGIFDHGGTFYRTDGMVLKIDSSCVTDHQKFQTLTEFLSPMEIQ
jgi:hypothetical protein